MSENADRALHAQDIDYAEGEAIFQGYFAALRAVVEPRPCVVLAHEWSGLNDPTKRLADRYARLGYVCFAVDVYGKGVRGDPFADNSGLMDPLMGNRALLRRRLQAGFAAASRLPGVDATRMAVVGYCFGGLCALDLARAGPANLRAAVSFHGGLGAPGLGEQRPIEASILLLHGWEDPVVPIVDVLDIAKEMTEANADWQLHAYGHARHAFTFGGANFPERGVVYDRRADERSWTAMRRHLAAAFGEDRAAP